MFPEYLLFTGTVYIDLHYKGSQGDTCGNDCFLILLIYVVAAFVTAYIFKARNRLRA